MKLFKTLLILIPCLIIAVLVIVALPRPERYVVDEEGVQGIFDDPTYVTNSDMGFFYKRDQLSDYRAQRKPQKPSVIKMSENLVTTDFTKTDVSVLPVVTDAYIGPRSLVMTGGELTEYTDKTSEGYTLKGGAQVASEDAFEVILDSSLLGQSDKVPHRIEKGSTYYAAFTSKLESIYFTFTSDNEFVSVILGSMVGRVEYVLMDSDMNIIKNGWNNSRDTMEIQYKGKGSAVYYIKVVGSFSEQLTPFFVRLPSDNNEWMWQMVYPDFEAEQSGIFDYYGDEDYFVLPPLVIENINKSVMRFTGADFDINIAVYDRNRTLIGQYVYKKGQSDAVSLYGLADAYAVSVYSFGGETSGAHYSFNFEYTDITILDIESYGFALSPSFNDSENYYTATVSSVADKKITDVMFSPMTAEIKISVKQQCGLVRECALAEELPLAPGRNTVTLTVTTGGLTRNITIVISDRTYDLSYGFITAATNGLSVNTKVLVIGTDSEAGKTQIQLCNGSNIGKYLWVDSNRVFSGYTETSMPDSYKDGINALKEAHPEWKFRFVKTGVDIDSFINSQLGDSSVISDGSKWNNASAEQIRYYVDPRNFFTEQSIFMFEKQTYADGIYSEAGVKSVWNDSVYSSYIMEAGQSTALSPYFIVARAAMESGRGSSALSKGTIPGYEGYYNFYGIGAYDSNPANGAVVAKNNDWNSKRRAIIEGAAWVREQYIGCQQYSIYFMKFSFVPNRSYHQYMTDITAPYKDAQSSFKSHKSGGTLNSAIEFVIPVFTGM